MHDLLNLTKNNINNFKGSIWWTKVVLISLIYCCLFCLQQGIQNIIHCIHLLKWWKGTRIKQQISKQRFESFDNLDFKEVIEVVHLD